MHRVEQALAERGCVKLNLQARADNDSATHFYRSTGFVAEERISMGKPLDPSKARQPL
ncbi:MAG: ribosomal protein S18 acetylase RimI-like enzyme [Limisphaerales bacterium]|jgi:ribosomal protein S18 acetylase RimI-like enzyme